MTWSVYDGPGSMKLRVLGCSGGEVPGHKLSCFFLDDSLLIDAGCVTSTLDLPAQKKIDNVLITHIHLDHTLALAMLADNLYGKSKASVRLWSTTEVIDGLKNFLFNNQIWPDFTQLTDDAQRVPVVKLCALPEREARNVGQYSVTAVAVTHVVPSVGYFIENKGQTLLHLGDTRSTDEVWSLAHDRPGLCAVVIESSFPDRLREVANASGHLTPQTLAQEIEKLGRNDVQILVSHLKPAFREEIIADLKKLKNPRVKVLRDGDIVHL